MVRVKPLPESLFAGGRITMRETTREIIHEITTENDKTRNRTKDPRGLSSVSQEDRYTVQYPSSPITNSPNVAYRRYELENINPNQYNSEVPNEYMTSPQDYPKALENQSIYSRENASAKWNYRKPLQKRQINEYMTQPESPISIESPRSYTSRPEYTRYESLHRDDHSPSQIQLQNLAKYSQTNRAKPSTTRYIKGPTTTRDAISSIGTSSVRSGGVPRYDPYSRPSKLKKKYRYRPGTRALQEIRRYQKSTHLLIPKLPFQRVIREVAMKLFPDIELRFTLCALEALREATEAFTIQIFAAAGSCALHGRRVTVKPVDIHLVRLLQQW